MVVEEEVVVVEEVDVCTQNKQALLALENLRCDAYLWQGGTCGASASGSSWAQSGLGT